jgi:hypothetical protein
MDEIASAVNSYNTTKSHKRATLSLGKGLENVKKTTNLPESVKDLISGLQKLVKASVSGAHATSVITDEVLNWIEESTPQGKLFSWTYGYQVEILKNFLIESEDANELKDVLDKSYGIIKQTRQEIEAHLRDMSYDKKYGVSTFDLWQKMLRSYKGKDGLSALESISQFIAEEVTPSVKQWILMADLLLIKQFSHIDSVKQLKPLIKDYAESDPTSKLFKDFAVIVLNRDEQFVQLIADNNGGANKLNTQRNSWAQWLSKSGFNFPSRDKLYYITIIKDSVN